MKRLFDYPKIFLALVLWLGLQATKTEAQTFMAEVAATTEVARMSLGEGIAQKDQLLLDLITKAGLMPVLSSNEEHTLFAPSMQVLQQHAADTPEQLRAFLEQHIVKGHLTAEDLRDGHDLKALSGNNLRICRKKGAVIVSGVRLKETDQLYANGVWHRLNGAFQPAVTSQL
ncbi:fasciclin domain-containing protein [Rufibacter immobilis]|uniref:Fasciclin domain-containing protein n=1 Tax=Rufibacter immobilis TaxID=1348778 RepID=A0A3M9N3C3_9BACT|nr:fasciclin domain-containing protein [Rufibacter immobilis]RNI32312.1 fasciclin domain-containing protein [Rufibacter immobilis]